MAAITWSTRVNVTLAGTTLTKTGGDPPSDDAYGIGTETLTADGSVTITIPALHNVVLGLSTNSAATTAVNLSHALNANTSGAVEIRELWAYKGETTYIAGDTIKIERVAGVVRYYKGATQIGTYSSTISGTLYVHSRFYSASAALTAGDITGAAGGAIPTLAAAVPTTQTTAPASYANLVTSLLPRPKPTTIPTPPALHGIYVDPMFNRRIRRGTDGTVGSANSLNKTHRMPSSSPISVWSRDTSQLYCVNPHGTVELFDVDANLNGKLTYVRDLNFTTEPTFSRVTAKKLYGAVGFQVKSHTTTSAASYPTVIDIAVVDAAYTGAGFAMGGTVQSSASSPERVVCFYGGSAQDTHKRVLVCDVANTANRLVLDTLARTINDVPVVIDFPFLLHSIGIEQGGNKVILYPRQPDISAGAAKTYSWNVTAGTVLPIRTGPDGHDAMGYNYRVNQDSSTYSPYDAFQYLGRSLDDASLNTVTVLVPVPYQPSMVYMGEHSYYDNARSDLVVPFGYVNQRIYEDTLDNLEADNGYNRSNNVPYRIVDNTVGMVNPDTKIVYVVCHHRTNGYADDGGSINSAFWYQPQGHPSPDGRFFVFSSNFEKTLGNDVATPTGPTQKRCDLWMVDLLEAQYTPDPPAPPTPVATGVILHGRARRTSKQSGTARLTSTRAVTIKKGQPVDFELYKGQVKTIIWTLEDNDDLTGKAITQKIRNAANTVVATITGVVTSPRTFRTTYPSATTAGFTAGPHTHDIWITDTGAEEPIVVLSKLNVLTGVTIPA